MTDRRLTTEEQRQARQLYAADPRRFNAKRLAERFGVGRRQIDGLVSERPPPSQKKSTRPEGKRAERRPIIRFAPDTRDATAQFFNDPQPHQIAAREQRKTEKP